MKTYKNHQCSQSHRTPRTFMRCAVPRAAWVSGQGRYAVIAWCRVPTVTLWRTPEEAQRARRQIDSTGCGGGCSRRHDTVLVEIP